jgi:hypothetical protein
MQTTANPTLSIPSFFEYVEDRKSRQCRSSAGTSPMSNILKSVILIDLSSSERITQRMRTPAPSGRGYRKVKPKEFGSLSKDSGTGS